MICTPHQISHPEERDERCIGHVQRYILGFGGETRGKETILYTYLLTPCSTVLLEKLTGSAASQEIPRIFGTRRFITVPTSARHLSLS